MRKLIILLTLVLVTYHCQASNTESWNKHTLEVQKKCLAASSLKNAKIAGQIASFDDAVGVDLLLLTGSYPQPHMKGQKGKELCLFNRKNKAAHIIEADNFVKKIPNNTSS